MKLCRLIGIVLVLAPTTRSAELGTYVLGSTGLKGGTMPPPGIYAISLDFAYRSTDFRDRNGDRITQVQGQKFSGKAEALLNITGISYISDLKVLGANYGMRAANTSGVLNGEMQVGPVHVQQKEAGNADVYFEPLNLSWHLPRFDLFTSYGFYAPVGDFRSNINDPVTVSDRWSHLISAGITAYLDASKKWALAIVPRYEIYQGNIHENFRAGQDGLFEWGISRTFLFTSCGEKVPWSSLDIGPIGYVSYKTTDDTGFGVAHPFERFSTHAAGVEASVTVPKWHAARFSFRFEQEFLVHSRPQGQAGILRFSVKF
jgi:hypothetical protein